MDRLIEAADFARRHAYNVLENQGRAINISLIVEPEGLKVTVTEGVRHNSQTIVWSMVGYAMNNPIKRAIRQCVEELKSG